MTNVKITSNLPTKLNQSALKQELPSGAVINARWNANNELIEIEIITAGNESEATIIDTVTTHAPTKSDFELMDEAKQVRNTYLTTTKIQELEARIAALEAAQVPK